MSEAEVARLVGEIVGLVLIVGGGFVWMVKLLFRVLVKLDHNTEQLNKINGTVARHEGELVAQKELNAWFSGVLGEPKPRVPGKEKE